ncbi:hypothetical protein DL96DRAFT_1758005 [Flagelloscypha sp. PMI_526]|nr:hypothetical protein DL96DRAFT_1758005 [Flagelloscypha sp. PMI_526]
MSSWLLHTEGPGGSQDLKLLNLLFATDNNGSLWNLLLFPLSSQARFVSTCGWMALSRRRDMCSSRFVGQHPLKLLPPASMIICRQVVSTSTASLLSLPSELHTLILQELLCTDDGSSIRSLGHASRYFRRLVLPDYFHTIRVVQRKTGMPNIFNLLRRLDTFASDPVSPSIRIRHLLIRLDHLDVQNSFGLSITNSQRCNDDVLDLKRTHLASVIHRLLRLAAPTLRTLFFLLPELDDTQDNPSLCSFARRLLKPGIHFPYLHLLVAKGAFYLGPSSDEETSFFPQLSRVILHGVASPGSIIFSGRDPLAFPSLTHLFISPCTTSTLKYVETAIHNKLLKRGLDLGFPVSLINWEQCLLPATISQFIIGTRKEIAQVDRRLQLAEVICKETMKAFGFEFLIDNDNTEYTIHELEKEWVRCIRYELATTSS